MTIQEATHIVYLIHAAYPQDRRATEAELLDRIDLWSVFFADYPVAIVDKAVKAWIKSSSFMPSVEEIKKSCDVRRDFERLIADAGYISAIPAPSPALEAKLDALIESIIESEEEGYRT